MVWRERQIWYSRKKDFCTPSARLVRGGGGTGDGGPLWVMGGCNWPQGDPLWVVHRHNIILCLLSALPCRFENNSLFLSTFFSSSSTAHPRKDQQLVWKWMNNVKRTELFSNWHGTAERRHKMILWQRTTHSGPHRGSLPKYAPKMHIWPKFGHFWHIWVHIWACLIWSSGVSLKRSCKMRVRRVGLRSNQKLWPNQIFGRFPHCNYNGKLKMACTIAFMGL